VSDLNEQEQEVSFEEGGPIQVLIEGIDEIPEREPTNPEMKKTKEELSQELAATRKSLEEERNRTLEMNAIRGLAEELKNQPRSVPAGTPQPLPGESEEDFQKRFNAEFYNNPYATMMEFQQKKLAPEVQRIMGANLLTSRKFLMIDPDRKETAAKYATEIDTEIERIPPSTKLYDPDIYQKVHDLVISRHVKDIVDMRVKEAMASTGKPTTTPKVGFSERGTAAPNGSNPRTIVLTRAEAEFAAAKGIPKEQYAGYLMRHPEARKK
jgi:hypothetical protein